LGKKESQREALKQRGALMSRPQIEGRCASGASHLWRFTSLRASLQVVPREMAVDTGRRERKMGHTEEKIVVEAGPPTKATMTVRGGRDAEMRENMAELGEAAICGWPRRWGGM